MKKIAFVIICVFAALMLGGFHQWKAQAATYSCNLTVPSVWAGDAPGEVYTGHTKGSCNFKWHMTANIEYKDRWHVLGVHPHGPFAPNTYTIVGSDEATYERECGDWRVRDIVLDSNGVQRWAGNGPVTTFCS